MAAPEFYNAQVFFVLRTMMDWNDGFVQCICRMPRESIISDRMHVYSEGILTNIVVCFIEILAAHPDKSISMFWLQQRMR